MTDQPFARWIVNSALVAVCTTVLGVFLACTAAYAFSRFKFPGRRAGMMGFLVSQMFPGTLMLIPLYIIIVQILGLGSSRLGLVIVYATTSIPFSVWMLKGYFDTIPKELEEAAVIEGASVGKIFWRIVLPLAKPAVAITALFCFMTAWNEFILAATFMDKEDMYTAPVGLRFFVGGFSQQCGLNPVRAAPLSAQEFEEDHFDAYQQEFGEARERDVGTLEGLRCSQERLRHQDLRCLREGLYELRKADALHLQKCRYA